MGLALEKKQEIISDNRVNDKDTGSPEVQVAMLTTRINELAENLKSEKPIGETLGKHATVRLVN